MKKLLFLLLMLGAVQAKAQVIKGSIDMRDSTVNRTIPFEVAAGTKLVRYTINIYTVVGAATISLTDPSDKKTLNVTIGNTTRGKDNEASKGELSDDLHPKIPGTWKFNFSAEHATGTISYQIEITKP